jgi:glycosyltransferase involved in cell wall biosynthesis
LLKVTIVITLDVQNERLNMHVIQVVPRFPPAIGGMEEHVYQISLELTRRGHNVAVVTSNEADGKTCPVQTEVMEGIDVYRFPLFMPRMLRESWFIPEILKCFLRLRADVVHVHGYRCLSSFNAVYFAQARNIPSVLTPHGIYPTRSFINGLAKSIFDHVFGRLLLSFSDKIIALSEHNRQLLLQFGASADKIVIVPNGVNVEEYASLQRSNSILEELKTDGPVLLYVGRIDWNKRVEKIVEAMPTILKEFPQAKFVAVGPDYGNYVDKLSAIARKLDVGRSLVIAGNVSRERLFEFYSAADAFLLPSSYEGFGLSMLEAMSSKVPVIASHYGGPGDILSHGVNAWLLKESTPNEISRSVYAVLTDRRLREGLVKNAFELVKKYTWKNVVNELEIIYEQTITEKAKNG